LGAGTLLSAYGLGCATMYWLDADSGRRRRGRARDVATHAASEGREMLGKGARDLRHRAAGAAAELRSAVQGRAGTDFADVVTARVRSVIGRACSHPHALEVTADDAGHVTLRGPILEAEADEVCARVARVRGVRDVDCERLERHGSAEHVASLQGGPRGRAARRATRSGRWTPAQQLVAGGLGAALVLSGLARGRGPGRAMMVGGAALLARAVTNEPARRLIGLRGDHGAIELRKSMIVEAPVDEVFRFMTDFENFPRFMQHVRRVRRLPDGRSHWVVDGLAGMPLQWDAEVTRFEPDKAFEWRTSEGSPVRHAGSMSFEPTDLGTRIDLRVSYEPVGGRIGQAIAAVLGGNPKRALDDDMLRFKSLLERGKTRAHGAEVSRDDVRS